MDMEKLGQYAEIPEKFTVEYIEKEARVLIKYLSSKNKRHFVHEKIDQKTLQKIKYYWGL